ncbi:31653_t:CDS:1, partial [Gigaspora margarita]
FNWTIERIPGKDNHIADWLSRQISMNDQGEQIITLKIGIKDKKPKGKEIPNKFKSENLPIKPSGIPTTPQ